MNTSNITTDVYVSIISELLRENSPAAIPVDVVDYASKGYALRIYHDDIQSLSDKKMEDFVVWLQEQAGRAEKVIGLPVVLEVSTYE